MWGEGQGRVLGRRAANRELGIKVCGGVGGGGDTAQLLGTLQSGRRERELKPLAFVFD